MTRVGHAALVFALASCVAFLAGCTGDASGRLTSLTLKAPIAGATIESEAGTASTDASGMFTIKSAPLGSLPVTVSVPGFPPFRAQVNAAKAGTGGASEIVLQDAALSGRLVERATEPAAIASASVQVAGVTATLTPEGAFSVAGLPSGAALVRASSSSHEATESMHTLKPGSNEVTVTLSITPLETYKRFFLAGQYHRDSLAYQYTHPDERSRITVSGWKKWSASVQDKSIKFGAIKTIASWKSPLTKKTYTDVVSIDRSIEYQVTDPKYSNFGGTYTENFSQVWAKLDGIWYILHKKAP